MRMPACNVERVSILGNRVLRREDLKLLTTGGDYNDDLEHDGALWATFVHSSIAHARITEIDVGAALETPGVVGVYTADDLDLAPLPPGVPGVPHGMARPILADGTVRFVGEMPANPERVWVPSARPASPQMRTKDLHSSAFTALLRRPSSDRARSS